MPSNFETQRDDTLINAHIKLGNQSGESSHQDLPRPLRSQSAKEEREKGSREGRVVAMTTLARENDDVIAVPVRSSRAR